MHGVDRLREVLEARIQSIEFNGNPQELYDPISYTLQSGGKRIRPVLFLLACEMFSDKFENAIDPAIGFEVFHNFTLLHDDIMDNAPVRRGKATVHEKWNANTAILSGDAMMVEAYRLVCRAPVEHLQKILELFSDTATGVCEGQMFDMLFESRNMVTEAEYLQMIQLKTSVLLAACLKGGAIIGGANNNDADSLYQFGIHLGLAFQLKDDWLDVFGDPSVFGKTIGGDIAENKKTFLWIKALEKAEKSDKEELHFWENQSERRMEKVEAVSRLYEKLGVRRLTSQKIEELSEKAFKYLDKVNLAPERKASLYELGNQLLDRNK